MYIFVIRHCRRSTGVDTSYPPRNVRETCPCTVPKPGSKTPDFLSAFHVRGKHTRVLLSSRISQIEILITRARKGSKRGRGRKQKTEANNTPVIPWRAQHNRETTASLFDNDRHRDDHVGVFVSRASQAKSDNERPEAGGGRRLRRNEPAIG